jgi:outer membrane protein OmpA-like peptidoglycan-associated protein
MLASGTGIHTLARNCSPGHTDSSRSDVFNQACARRGQSVADFLIAAGIAAERLRPVGYGETQPIASDDTSAGRELNRRVEFSFGPASDPRP